MKSTESLSVTLNPQTLHWISLSYLLMLLPLYSELTPLIYIGGVSIIGWRYAIASNKLKPPQVWLKNLLAILCMVGIALLWRTVGLLPAMLNLLVAGCTLKFLEFNSRRHLSFHVLSLFFLTALTLIYHQSIGFTLYTIVVITLNAIALLSIYQVGQYQHQARLGLRLLLQSLPLMMVMFVLIPHVGPMWRLPDIKKATTGLSDNVAPGDIAELSRSSALAFRASFEGEFPPAATRYWRALVLEQFDGQRWQVAPELHYWQQQQRNPYITRRPVTEQINWQGRSETYRILAEPTQQQWLYSLDYSRPNQNDVFLTPAHTLFAEKPLQQKQQILLTYFPQTVPQSNLSAGQRARDLQLPANLNPQTTAWVAQLRRQYPDDLAYAQAVMRYFNQGFSYTLRPPVLQGINQIDDFLFGSRRGFCAHYASAFTYMMRVAGIPARMVTGYLGGEENATGQYLSLYQYDAHAWSEVWLNNRWQRFDPTLMVAPDRAEQTIDDVLPADETRLRDPFNLASYRHVLLLAQLHSFLADMDYRWSVWVLNYNNQSQQQLLADWFGSSIWARALAMLSGLIATAVAIFAIAWLTRKREKIDPLLRAYLQACARITKKYGITRRHDETPQQFMQRVESEVSVIQKTIRQITDCYQAARYRADNDAISARKQIRKLTRQL